MLKTHPLKVSKINSNLLKKVRLIISRKIEIMINEIKIKVNKIFDAIKLYNNKNIKDINTIFLPLENVKNIENIVKITLDKLSLVILQTLCSSQMQNRTSSLS